MQSELSLDWMLFWYAESRSEAGGGCLTWTWRHPRYVGSAQQPHPDGKEDETKRAITFSSEKRLGTPRKG